MTTFCASIYCRGCGQLLSKLPGVEMPWMARIGENVAKTTKMCSNFCLEKGSALNVMATIVWQREPVVYVERTEAVALLSVDCLNLSSRASRIRDALIQQLEENK